MLDTLKFIRALYETVPQGTYVEVRRRFPNGQLNQHWLSESSMEQVSQLADSKSCNCYFGVGLRSVGGSREDDVQALPCYWADVDVAKDLGGNWTQAHDTIDQFEFPPPRS